MKGVERYFLSLNMSDLFGAPYKVQRIAATVSLITLVAFFMGPYYWPASNAAWAAFLRIGVLVSVVLYVSSGISCYRRNTLWMTTIIFFLYLMLNSLFLGEDMQSVRRLVFIAFFVFMVANFWVEPVLPRILLGLIASMGACFAAFSLLNLYRLNQLELSYRVGAVFSSGEPGLADFGNTIVAAMHYAVCYCASLWLLLGSKNRYLSVLWALCLGVLVTYIILTFSRTAWAACLISSFSLLALSVRYNAWRRVFPIILVLLGLLGWFCSKYLIYEVQIRGLTHRDDIWLTVLQRVESNFLLGYGGGSKMEPIPISGLQVFVNTAHSTYLEVLYQFGMVGLLLMGTLLIMALTELLKSVFAHQELRAATFGLALLVAVAVVMLVELNGFVNSPNLLWIWFWLPLGIALSQTRGNNAEYQG